MIKIEVSKVVLKIKGEELELSLSEARGLKDALDELFKENRTCYLYPPYTWPYYPWTTTYTSTSGTMTISSSDSNTND